MYRSFLILVTMICLLVCATAYAKPPSVAVVYPDVREPYRAVFVEIVRGMEQELGQPVTHYQLSDRQNAVADLAVRMKNDRIDVVVTLGRAGYEAAKSLVKTVPVVVGAVVLQPGRDSHGLSGISLTPDPEILFARLRELAPNTRDVTVIYDPIRKSGEIALAHNAAKSRGLTLHAQPSTDLRRSAAIYQKALQEIDDGSGSIWLPQDNAAMDDHALIPQLLRDAWDKRFVVFSGNLDHVRKGALFSLYPNNSGMGRSLAVMARDRAQGRTSRGATIEPLRDLLTAVNLRTAEHLGLRFTTVAKRAFGMTFPSRP